MSSGTAQSNSHALNIKHVSGNCIQLPKLAVIQKWLYCVNLHSKTLISSVIYKAQSLQSDSVVTGDNCRQHGDNAVEQLCSHYAVNSRD